MIYLWFRLYRFNKAVQSKDSSMIRKKLEGLHQSQMNHLYKLRQPVQLNHCDHLQILTLKHSASSVRKEKYLRTLINSWQREKADVIYHQSCWIYKQREASKDERTFDENHNDTANVKSDIEIINIMKYELMHLTASTLDMNNVNNTYIEYWKTAIAAILKSIINHN